MKIIGNDSFSANETPEFVIEIEQAFIDAISDADSGEPVEIQIYVESCNGSRIELFVEEEETSPSSNIIKGTIEISGSENTINGGLFADTVKLSALESYITAAQIRSTIETTQTSGDNIFIKTLKAILRIFIHINSSNFYTSYY